MLKICLVFWKSEPQYTYKRYAYKKTCISGRPQRSGVLEIIESYGQFFLG